MKPQTASNTDENVSQRSKEAMSFGKKSQQQVTFSKASEMQNNVHKTNEYSSEKEENEMSKPYWERKNFQSYK